MNRDCKPWLALLVLPLVAMSVRAQPANPTNPGGNYVGSAVCRKCHEDIYDRWKKTPMANILVDVKEHPEAILGDFARPNPLVTFTRRDITFTYGSVWKQRYFVKRGNDYYVYPVQWDIANKVWRPYHPGPKNDWWVPFYPDDQMQRPTGPLCDGCHSTNYNIKTKQVTEWNVGCEDCHGPGETHSKNPETGFVVNPARLDFVRANDVCIRCHSQGRPLQTPLDGVYYDWPVGFEPGDRLADYWRLEDHKLGEETFTHWPEGSAHKNRMQGNDYVQSVMYTRGITCFSCHDVHGTENHAELLKPANTVCLSCHGPQSPLGPRDKMHSQHSAEKAQCVDCHMPKIVNEIADLKIRSHTFRFISPADTERYGVPNPCLLCHKDKDTAWAKADLAKWETVSPWRVAQ